MKNDSKMQEQARSERPGVQPRPGTRKSGQQKKLKKVISNLPATVSADTLSYLLSPAARQRMQEEWEKKPLVTAGVDLGDRKSNVCLLNQAGEMVGEFEIETTPQGFERFFQALPKGRVGMEVGTHSPWASRLVSQCGHEVIVANARKLSKQRIKTDKRDARMLANKTYQQSEELRAIHHRSEQHQKDMVVVQVRAALVQTRTKLITTARGLVKGFGERLPAGDAGTVTEQLAGGLPDPIGDLIKPLLRQIESINLEMELLDDKIKELVEQYPETKEMLKIRSVGPVTALTFVLTISDPKRFDASRTVGVVLGMTPGKAQSGQLDPQLGISKAGNGYMRGLFVQCAHLVLSKRGGDSDIRRWGIKLMGDGTNRKAKKRAVIAVARKLAVLLHKLWVSQATYEPFYYSKQQAASKRSVAA